MREIGGQTFNGCHSLAFHSRYGRNAGSNGLSIEMHRASSAQSHPTPKLGAGHSQGLAQDPQQWSGGIYIYLHVLSIYKKTCHQ